MAGDAEVKLKFVSDEKALAAMEQRLASVTAKLDAMAAAGKKVGQTKVDPLAAAAKRSSVELEKQPGLIDAAGSAASRYLAPLALAATAVKLIANEWNNVIERQQKAGQAAITFEEALGEATLNVGAVMAPDRLKERALAMSAETGVAPATAVSAISLAIKSGGATNEAEANRLADAAVVAGKLSPRAGAEKLADTSGSIASYMARTGATAEQAGGVLLSMQSKSNIADPNKAMAAAGPTLANILAQGASEGMAQGLMPALSQAIEDTQGDVSALAATQFTQSLAEAGASRFKGQKNIPDKMLAAMRADPELARQFFSGELINEDTGQKIGKPELGRGKAETFFRAISGDKTLGGDAKIIGSYVKQFDEFSAQAINQQQAGRFYNERLDQVRDATPTLQADRLFKSTAEQNRLDGPDALRGVSREGMVDLLQSAGASDLSQRVSKLDFDISSRPALKTAAGELRTEAFSLRQGSLWQQFLDSGNPEARNVARDPQSEATAQRLDRAAAALEKIAERNAERPFDRKGNVENVENN